MTPPPTAPSGIVNQPRVAPFAASMDLRRAQRDVMSRSMILRDSATISRPPSDVGASVSLCR